MKQSVLPALRVRALSARAVLPSARALRRLIIPIGLLMVWQLVTVLGIFERSQLPGADNVGWIELRLLEIAKVIEMPAAAPLGHQRLHQVPVQDVEHGDPSRV